ncbi:MFS transporter [Streptomyces sp. A0958]|uniref:MFS transporter n=1 Tax=Streptomyces sp. A0958 TaxID=2563101 RepID=UPI00109E760D|nr:MFS transporter [Streptomyces sp. A0958]THA70127.1 MFS transporter [Streptomyces sp. A0958]
MGKRYYLLLSAYLTSSIGNWVYRITLPLLVLHQTGSALSTSLVYVVEYVPFLLLSLPGGVWADRWNRRSILIGGDLAAALLASALAVLVIAGTTHLWPILLAAFLLGCVDPVYHPAFQSLLPDIVAKEKLGKANGWLQSGDNLMVMLGPAVAGGAIALFGYGTTVTFNACTFFVSAGAILLIGKVGSPGQDRTVRSSILKDIGEAGKYIVKKNKALLAGSLIFTGTNFATWIVQANFVFYLTTYRHLNSTVLGVVIGCQGVGALVGAALAGRLNERFDSGRIIIVTTAIAGCTTLILIPLRDPVLIGLDWALLFSCASINVVTWFTMRQKIVPGNLLGRVVASTRMLAFASIPLAALLGGVLESNFHNIYLIMVVSGVVRLGIAALAWFSPLRGDSRASETTKEGPAPSPVGEQTS